MSVTRLKRKHRKNIARANNKQRVIKNMLRTPVLKNVDLEELKSRFSTTTKVAAVIDQVKHAAADVVDAVAHSSVVEKVKEVASDAVAATKHAVTGDDATTEETAA